MSGYNLIFFGTFSFPSGDAAGARVLELAKGAVELGNNVTIISLFGEEKGWQEISHNRLSINYVSTGFPKVLGSSFVSRVRGRLHFYKSRSTLIKYLKETVEEKDKNVIYFYGRSRFYLDAVLDKVSIKGKTIKVCVDIVEPPSAKQGLLYSLFHPFTLDAKRMFSEKVLKRIDLGVFISHGLKNKFGKNFNKVLVVPSVVSLAIENKDLIVASESNYSGTIKLGYLGALLEKDDPKRLIEFCNYLYKANIPFELHVIGRSNVFKEGRYWRSKLGSSEFASNIVFHDNLKKALVNDVLKSMDYNILLRSKDVLQEMTFPTRIIDLLVANRPVIINLFGDLKEYFTHKYDCIDLDKIGLDSINREMLFNKKFQDDMQEKSRAILEYSFNAKIQIAKALDLIS